MKQKKAVVKSKGLVRKKETRVERFLKRGAFPHVTREEYQRILAETTSIELRILLEVLWTTGARISEVLSLRARDLVRREGEYYLNVLRLKRRSPVRELLPIPLEMGLKLEDFVRLRGIGDEKELFCISRVTVWRNLRAIGERVLGREVYPHMFRHGRIYDLARQGRHPFVIARIVGHVNLETTMGYYHPGEDDIREALS